MYYLVNVNHYLTGEPYSTSTILDDIDKSFDAYLRGCCNNLITAFVNNLKQYLSYQMNNALTFANLLMSDSFPMAYQDIMLHSYLPFKNSKDPMVDKKILERYFKIDNLDLDIAVLNLLYMAYPAVYNNDNKMLLSRINAFFNSQRHLTFENVNDSPQVGFMSAIKSPQEICDDYLNISNKPVEEHSKIIGDYGELLAYNKLYSTLQQGEQLLWVSHYVGDGFGYDLAKYNAITNTIDLYEVKTTTHIGSNSLELTKTESNVCNAYSTTEDNIYHIIKVILYSNGYDMYDVNDNESVVTDINNIENKKVLIREKSAVNKYTIA